MDDGDAVSRQEPLSRPDPSETPPGAPEAVLATSEQPVDHPALIEEPSIELFRDAMGARVYAITDGGKWSPPPDGLLFQWTRNGQPITDPLSNPARGPRYDLTLPRDFGKKLVCLIWAQDRYGEVGDSAKTKPLTVYAEESDDDAAPGEPDDEPVGPDLVQVREALLALLDAVRVLVNAVFPV